jgi:hypothetical protein
VAKLGNPQETIQVLQKHDFHFQKKFGQNFLIDPHVLKLSRRQKSQKMILYWKSDRESER